MNAKLLTPLFLVLTLLVSACGGILPESVSLPPAQAIQSCSVGKPEAVVVNGKKWICVDVLNAVATMGAPASTTAAPAAATSAPAATAAPLALATGSLKYDETGGTTLMPGQKQLIALYYRLPAPISQSALEGAVVATQKEAAAANATVFEGTTLKLDQKVSWLVWCSNATQVDPPADVSLVHEVTLLAKTTLGRVWIQVPFAEGVPLRSDDTWTGCASKFWATRLG